MQDEIKAYLQGTADTILSKDELISALQAVAAKYPASIHSGYGNGLHQFILGEAEKAHPGLVEPEDVEAIFS
jgi:hypothetical protein